MREAHNGRIQRGRPVKLVIVKAFVGQPPLQLVLGAAWQEPNPSSSVSLLLLSLSALISFGGWMRFDGFCEFV